MLRLANRFPFACPASNSLLSSNCRFLRTRTTKSKVEGSIFPKLEGKSRTLPKKLVVIETQAAPLPNQKYKPTLAPISKASTEQLRQEALKRREKETREREWQKALERRKKMKQKSDKFMQAKLVNTNNAKPYSKERYKMTRVERAEKRKKADIEWKENSVDLLTEVRLRGEKEQAEQLAERATESPPLDIFDLTALKEPSQVETPKSITKTDTFEITPITRLDALPDDPLTLPIRQPKKLKPSARGWGPKPKKPKSPLPPVVKETKEEDKPWFVRHRKVMKEKFPQGWNPKRKIPRDSMQLLRDLHVRDPKRYPTAILADRFKISPEAVRRILRNVQAIKDPITGEIVAKASWEPSPDVSMRKDQKKRIALLRRRQERLEEYKKRRREDMWARRKPAVMWAARESLGDIPEV